MDKQVTEEEQVSINIKPNSLDVPVSVYQIPKLSLLVRFCQWWHYRQGDYVCCVSCVIGIYATLLLSVFTLIILAMIMIIKVIQNS